MEREPDFEDERIRLWRYEPPGLEPEDDPTVLRISQDTEDPHESRVYRVRSGAENLAVLTGIMTREAPDRPALPPPVAALLSERFMHEGVVKLLSKRYKESGDVSLLIVATGLGRRFLLRPLRTFTAEGYQDKLAAFEQEWVAGGLLIPGPVIGPGDWPGYQKDAHSGR